MDFMIEFVAIAIFYFYFYLLSQVLSETLGNFALASVMKASFESQINQPQERLYNICAEIDITKLTVQAE